MSAGMGGSYGPTSAQSTGTSGRTGADSEAGGISSSQPPALQQLSALELDALVNRMVDMRLQQQQQQNQLNENQQQQDRGGQRPEPILRGGPGKVWERMRRLKGFNHPYVG